jgi:lipopolysaccharide export system permease protein
VGILFRYIFWEVMASSLVGAVLFTFVLFLRQVGPIMELLVGPSVSYAQVLHLILLALPQTLRFTIPMGVLVGVLVGLGRLSTDGEITAMRAAGIPSRRVALPIFVFALLGALLCALTTLNINPRAQRALNAITETLKISQATAEIPPRVFIEKFPNVVLYVRNVVPGATVRWQGVFLADMRPPADRGSVSGVRSTVDGPAITVAEEAVAVPRPEQSRIQLHLSQATRYEQSSNPDDYYFQGFGQTDQVLEIAPSGLALSSRPFDHMDTAELARAARSGEHATQASIELQQRWSFPVACLVFPLVGIPLAITSQRSGRSVGVVFSVVLTFAYWMIWLAGVALAIDGVLPVVPAIWMANVIFAAAGSYLLWQLDASDRRDMAAALLGRALDFIAGLRSGPRPPVLPPDELPTGRERRRRPRTVAEPQTPLPLFRILDRYVLRTFLYYFAILVAAFVLIWFVFSFFELLSDMLAREKLGLFIPYIYYLTPFLIYETTPLGVLVATLVCFGILAKHQELTAFKACGVSLYRLAAPILAVSFLFSGLLFSLDYYYLPETNRKQDAIRDEIKGRPVSTYLRPDRQWTAGQGDRIFYHRFFDSANKVLAGINLYDFDPKTFQLRRHISAERARWDEARSVWVFENGWVRGIKGDQVPLYYETFTERSFPDLQEDPAYFMKEDRQYQQMNWEELRAYILDLTQSGFDTIRLQVQLHKKLAFPLFAFVMAVLAVPFSLLAGHRGALTGVVLGIALAIAYYALNALFEQMGRANQLTPAIAAWSPSLIFGLSGAYLFARVRS